MTASDSIRYRDSRNTGLVDVNTGDDEQWRPLAMATSCLMAAIFVVSWLFEPGRVYWDQLDLAVFRKLNGTLEWGSVWQGIWAVTNSRPFDLVTGITLLLILVGAARWRFAGRPVQALGSLAVLTIVSLIVLESTSEFVVRRVLNYDRGSPTLVLEDTLRLSSLVDWVDCKDISQRSFPSDHGFVFLMCALYVSYVGNKRLRVAVWLVAILGVLPRLVGGAHWVTDSIVGSGTMALVTTAFLFATPLHDYLLSLIPDRLSRILPGGRKATVATVARHEAEASAIDQGLAPTRSVTEVAAPQIRRAS